MARKTNSGAGLGCLLMIIGFILLFFAILPGVAILLIGAVLGILGVLAGLFSDIFGLDDESSDRIIIVNPDPRYGESRDSDLPAWLRTDEPEATEKKPKKIQKRI